MDCSKFELLLEQQFKLLQLSTDTEIISTASFSASTLNVDATINNRADFNYNPVSKIASYAWFGRYDDV